MLSVPFVGPGAGVVARPSVGAGVWIEFEQAILTTRSGGGCWKNSASPRCASDIGLTVNELLGG